MTVSGGAGSFAQGQISDEKNRVVAASVSSHPRELWISLLLQCLPVSLALYCIVLSAGSAMVQKLQAVEFDKKNHAPAVSRNLNEVFGSVPPFVLLSLCLLYLFPQALEALTHKEQLRSQLAKQSSLSEEEQDSKTMADLRSQLDSLQLQLTKHESNTQALTEKLTESNVCETSLCLSALLSLVIAGCRAHPLRLL